MEIDYSPNPQGSGTIHNVFSIGLNYEPDELLLGDGSSGQRPSDVMTFYQERIANEGYLRTATERRSVLELARLVGYKPRPGVSSSVFLAYNIDDNFKEETTIPIGSRAQSIPGPDEFPQAFEISEELIVFYIMICRRYKMSSNLLL